MTLSLTAIQKAGPQFLADLRDPSPGKSIDAAGRLVAEAKSYGLGMRDFLTLKVDGRMAEAPENFAELDGYEASLAYLNLPVRDDFKNGVVLQLAGETFQTFPGTRAMFPEVVDDMVRWKYRQDELEVVGPLVASSRTINGVEMISTVVDDKKEDYEVEATISEMGRIPVSSIRTTQYSVGIFKHGRGYRTSYEFQRRANLELLVPYANRANRETERSKVRAATSVLLNGDGVASHGAAVVRAQSFYNTAVGTNATDGKISYMHLLRWLVARAKAGTPVDTVIGNWDAYIQWLMLFALPTSDKTRTDAEALAAAGFKIGGVPVLTGIVNFALSSAMPDNQLLGYSRGDTLEELIEAGSLIDESERAPSNQTITYYRTINSGYKLAFGDTREVYDFGN